MRIFFIALFACSLASLYAAPDAYYTPEYKKAFGYITQLRFAEARQIVDEQRGKNPQNRVGSYLDAAMICAEIFANEDQQRFVRAQERIDALLLEIEEVEASNPFRNLFLGEIHLAQATLNGKFKNNIKAAWQFYKAYGLLTENAKRFPEFMPHNISLGVLYAGIGSLPEDYRSMAGLLGFEGSVQGGLAMVKKAFWRLSADEDLNFYRPYAGFVYSYVTHQLGTSSNVSPQSLSLDVTKSSFLIYAQAIIELENGNAEEALKWLDSRPRGERYFDFNYMDYLQGKILLGLNPERAIHYFEKYLQSISGDVYVKSTYRYLSWCYLLKGKEEKAEEMRENVFRKGSTTTGADRQALQEATDGFNYTLIKARVLFDVGKYDKADAFLKGHPVKSCCDTPAEEAEYYYRYGRIKQEQEQVTEAVLWFSRSLGVVNAGSTFAVGNSALQLGLLYEQQGDVRKAKEYFRKTLKYSGYPFYEGIHQKAKAGLSRLKG